MVVGSFPNPENRLLITTVRAVPKNITENKVRSLSFRPDNVFCSKTTADLASPSGARVTKQN
jgi:hypothetical protein